MAGHFVPRAPRYNGSVPCVRRRARREGAGGSLIPLVRLVDDFSDSDVNAAASIGGALPVDSLDILVSLASAAIAGRGERAEIRFRKGD